MYARSCHIPVQARVFGGGTRYYCGQATPTGRTGISERPGKEMAIIINSNHDLRHTSSGLKEVAAEIYMKNDIRETTTLETLTSVRPSRASAAQVPPAKPPTPVEPTLDRRPHLSRSLLSA